LLESSEHYEQLKKEFNEHGVKIKGVELDLGVMMARKNKVVSELTQGIESLFKTHKIDYLQGKGKLLTNHQVSIVGHGKYKERVVEADNIILATGSSSVDIPAAPLKEDVIVDSTGALEFKDVPGRLGVIGAGVIGLELGSVWRRLGSEVIVLEAQEEFLHMADEQISKDALRQFTKQGLDIHLGARVVSCEVKNNKVNIEYQDKEGSHKEKVD